MMREIASEFHRARWPLIIIAVSVLVWQELSERTKQDLGAIGFIILMSVVLSCVFVALLEDSRIQGQMRDDQAKILRHQAKKIDEEDASEN